MTKKFKLTKKDSLMIGKYKDITYIASDPVSIILPEDNVLHPDLYSKLLESQSKKDFVFIPNKLLQDYLEGYYTMSISESIASYRVKIIGTYKNKTIIRYNNKKYILIDSKIYKKLCDCGYYMYITTSSIDCEKYLYKIHTHKESGREFYSGSIGLKDGNDISPTIGVLRTTILEKDIDDINNFIDSIYEADAYDKVIEALKHNPLYFNLAEEAFRKLYNLEGNMKTYFINKAFEVLTPYELKEIYKKGL